MQIRRFYVTYIVIATLETFPIYCCRDSTQIRWTWKISGHAADVKSLKMEAVNTVGDYSAKPHWMETYNVRLVHTNVMVGTRLSKGYWDGDQTPVRNVCHHTTNYNSLAIVHSRYLVLEMGTLPFVWSLFRGTVTIYCRCGDGRISKVDTADVLSRCDAWGVWSYDNAVKYALDKTSLLDSSFQINNYQSCFGEKCNNFLFSCFFMLHNFLGNW